MSTLYLVSTPIGNLEDITIRALKTLFSVDIVACEDTRVTGNLLELLKNKYHEFLPTGTKPSLVSYHDANEETMAPELIHLLESGKNIALVSDAGTPLVSDPGYRIVLEAKKRIIPVIVVPGASAVLTALVGSGLPTNNFTFLGYLPEKQGKRVQELENIRKAHGFIPSTYVCYIAPHKLIHTVEDLKTVYGDIPVAIARELTKLHEEYWSGTLSEALKHFSNPKGEFVLLFSLPSGT